MLRLWGEGENFFSVITLAGAAEEKFGKCVKAAGKDNSLQSQKQAFAVVYRYLFDEDPDEKEIAQRLNYAKNSSKHFSQGKTVTLDVEEEAKEMLIRAIDNYWLLEESLTPVMEAFERSQRGA